MTPNLTSQDSWTRHSSGGGGYRISGGFAQVLELRLGGLPVISQTGRMAWMKGATMTPFGGLGGLGRAVSGGGFFLMRFDSEEPEAIVGFAPRSLGTIIPYSLDRGSSLLCERRSFLAGEGEVNVTIALQKSIKAGVFGGEGFVLQKISGTGLVFLTCGGLAVEHNLNAGETLTVDPGHVAFFEDSVAYEVSAVAGIRNFFFSGEGLFLARLTGPGRVWTQSYGGDLGTR